MAAPIATEPALREHLAAWLQGQRRSNLLLVRARPQWSGNPILRIGEHDVRIVEGVSGLAALDAIRPPVDSALVAILTELDEVELGAAVVLGAERQRVSDLDEWSIVPTLLGVRGSDVSGPVRALGAWAPRVLSAVQRSTPYPPAPGGVLTAEIVVTTILLGMLDLARHEELEGSLSLTPLDQPATRARLLDLDAQDFAALCRAVDAHVSPQLALALRVAASPTGVSPIAVGLAVAELWGTTTDHLVAAARVRIESYLGRKPSDDAAQRYGEAARAVARRTLASEELRARQLFEQAEALLGDLGWAEGAAASSLLVGGLHQRIAAFSTAILAAVEQPSAAASLMVDAALANIERHEATSLFDRSRPTARMAIRLVRWLSIPREPAASLERALLEYSEDGAWAEFALGDLWDGDTDSTLARAYAALAQAVQAERRAQDATAAAHLTGELLPPSTVVPVERLLTEVVQPIAQQRPTLVIVLDGMSVATAAELVAEIPAHGWAELVDASSLLRSSALAALPTVTEYSRTSLFSGTLLAGNQQVEKARFSAALAGVLFHKDDLRADAGRSLPAAVTDAIADRSQQVVAAVLNTIDDALGNADVDALRWSVRSVAKLEALLDAARSAGRAVILTSDHGHVAERGSLLRAVPQAAARWRDPATGAPASDEVLVVGPRVLAEGGTAVLAVSDGIRFASKRAGYHGGASLAELTIPIIVLKPRGAEDLDGWVEAPPQMPSWWHEALRQPSPKETAPQQRAPRRARPDVAIASAPTLFDAEPELEPAATDPRPDLIEQLIGGELFSARRARAGRHPIDIDTARSMLTVLVDGGGRAHRETLAAAARLPSTSMPGLLASLKRVLNVDGYPVIDNDADLDVVVLDMSLLREQFALGGGS